MKKQTLFKITAAFMTISLIAILLSHIEVADIVDTLTGIEPVYLMAGFGLYVLSYFFRALRFYVLLDNKVGLKDLFGIVCLHNMANNIFPARTGELSYIYLIKKNHHVPIRDGIASLMVARVFDFIAIAVIFLISFNFLSDNYLIVPQFIKTLMLIVILIAIISLVFICSKKIIDYVKFTSFCVVVPEVLIDFLTNRLNTIAKKFDMIANTKHITNAALLSTMVWFTSFMMGYLLIINMGIQLDIWAILVGFTFSVLISILPIHGIGGFGTMEGGWAVIFIALGAEKEIAILTGFAYHIIIIIFTILLGICGMLLLNQRIESKLSISFKKVIDYFF